jgi:putative copper resistance protein D
MVDAGLIAARLAAYAATLLAAGLPFHLLTTDRGVVPGGQFRAGIALLALAAAIASTAWALASVASMSGQSISQLDLENVTAVLQATPLGAVLELRLLALGLLFVMAAFRVRVWMLALPAAVALGSWAWTGHSGATEGDLGLLHKSADVVHLFAAALWLGALARFLAALFRRDRPSDLERRLVDFGTTGSFVVALLLATGIANMVLVGGWPPQLASLWAALLGLKLALFFLMLGIAALNRWRLVPMLAVDERKGSRALRLSVGVEAAAALAIIVLVSALGVYDPAGGS